MLEVASAIAHASNIKQSQISCQAGDLAAARGCLLTYFSEARGSGAGSGSSGGGSGAAGDQFGVRALFAAGGLVAAQAAALKVCARPRPHAPRRCKLLALDF